MRAVPLPVLCVFCKHDHVWPRLRSSAQPFAWGSVLAQVAVPFFCVHARGQVHGAACAVVVWHVPGLCCGARPKLLRGAAPLARYFLWV